MKEKFIVLLHNVLFCVFRNHIGRFMHYCYGLNVCVSPKCIYGRLNPQCDGIWKWGLWEVISFRIVWDPHDGIIAFIRRGRQSDLSPGTCTKDSSWEYIARKKLSTSQELNLLAPSLWISQSPKLWKKKKNSSLSRLRNMTYFSYWIL